MNEKTLLLIGGADPLSQSAGVYNAPAVAIDTETTGLEYLDRMVMISMAWRVGEVLYTCCLMPSDWDEAASVEVLGTVPVSAMNEIVKNHRVVMHNLPFDFRVLYKSLGTLPGGNMHDTIHLAKQIGWHEELSLASLTRLYLGEVPEWVEDMKEHRKTFIRQDMAGRIQYAMWDAENTLCLYEIFRNMAPQFISADLYRRDLKFTKLVMEMMIDGLKLNPEFCTSRIAEFSETNVRLADKYLELGVTNLNSDDQIRALLFDRMGLDSSDLPKTGKGRVSLAAEVMQTLGEVYEDVEVMQDVLTFRQLRKCVNDWLTTFLDIAEIDGKIHSEIHPFGTRSFRMTARTPNLLALPMENRGRAFGSLQGIFTATDPDRKLYGLDVKQAEVRLGGMLAQEDNLAHVFQDGADPYAQMAVSIWGETNKELRRRAKAAMLAGLYEIGPRTFSQKHKLPEAEARRVLDDFRARFPNIKAASKFYASFAEQHNYVPLFDGRRRYFAPDDDFYKAFNQRVQGGVAEIMQTAMLEIANEFPPGFLKLQIHDAVIVELSRDEEKRAAEVAKISAIVAGAIPENIYAMTNPRIPFLIDEKEWE